MEIRLATQADAATIAEILNALIESTTIEWTESLHTTDRITDWIRDHDVVLVAELHNEIVGVAAFGWFRDAVERPGYRFTVEHSIHVRRDHWGNGVGRLLMEHLIDRARDSGKHVMVAAIDGSNEASIRFHERLGFVEVARMPEIGAKFGAWHDLVLMQLRLDDRANSPVGPPDEAAGSIRTRRILLGTERDDRPKETPVSAFDAEYEPSPWDPIAGEVERYERTNGTEPSEIVGEHWIILWTLGAKSGKVRKTPLVRVADEEGRYAVIGSMGGAPTHPQWVHNVRANPIARLQDGATVHDYAVREVDGDEKATWWARATQVWPDYDSYQASTERVIPLFVLEPTD